MKESDLERVLQIYKEGLETKVAIFETETEVPNKKNLG